MMRRSKEATVAIRPSVLSTHSRPDCCTRPPGISTFCSIKALRTSPISRPNWRRRSGSTATCTARTRDPINWIAPTSCTVSKFSLRRRSTRKVNSLRSRGELTATEKTGVASTSNLSTMGVSVPGGSRDRIELTLSRTSWAARSRFRSKKNCAVIEDTPSRLEELSSSMPSTVLMISSIG